MSVIKCAGCEKPLKGKLCIRLVVELAQKKDTGAWVDTKDQATKILDWNQIPFGSFHLECAQQIVDRAESAYYRDELSELPLDELLEEHSGPTLQIVK